MTLLCLFFIVSPKKENQPKVNVSLFVKTGGVKKKRIAKKVKDSPVFIVFVCRLLVNVFYAAFYGLL